MAKPLPIGIQTFRKIIEGGYLYVDKTRWVYELIRYPHGVYFLSRPRRFGKSLLVSTLEEVFRGNKELFRGLWLYDQPYDWRVHPVIRLDFSLRQVESTEALKQSIERSLYTLADQYQVTLRPGPYDALFADLIRELSRQGQVVILVDEYDKPILDNIEDLANAEGNRDVLRSFYTVIKGMDAYIRFVLLTGVSKFSRVGVFSGLNNLEDITMSPAFSAALGFTDEEVRIFFAEHIEEFARKEGTSTGELLRQIQHWYDGFCFTPDCQQVYNPFSLLLLFKQQHFANFWFESGTPSFLIKLIKAKGTDIRQFDELLVDELAFSTYELDNLQVLPLLFQTGYLTIREYDKASRLYRLAYPNLEVERAFLSYLLSSYSRVENGLAGGYLSQLAHALWEHDFKRFFDILTVFFAAIPYDIQISQERYYQTIFYLIFKLMGFNIGAEVRTSRGRADAVVELAEGIFIFEFKLNGNAAQALQQIKERGYAEPYRSSGKPVYLAGIGFDAKRRTIGDWQVERLDSSERLSTGPSST